MHTTDATATASTYVTLNGTDDRIPRPLPHRLLGVWAHPDDEAYLSAGLMARVVQAGGHVTVVTATRGERGTDDPAQHGTERFAARRERELRQSLAELGVTDLRLLGLDDGRCDAADPEAMIDAIGRVVDEVRPHAIVTFGPDGITNHRDHRAVSRWATEAWRRSTGAELLYATMTDEFVTRHAVLHDQLGIFTDFGAGEPAAVPRSRVALECSLTPPELDRKGRALDAHDSQTAPLMRLMGADAFRAWWADEWFRRPTAKEAYRCTLPDWSDSPAPELVGAS
jgi:LmbE family N-acetylglucosaminyl deacetylase